MYNIIILLMHESHTAADWIMHVGNRRVCGAGLHAMPHIGNVMHVLQLNA